MTADHVIIGNDREASAHGDKAALVMMDAGTKWVDCFPSATKSAEDTLQALQNFVGPRDKLARFYTEFRRARCGGEGIGMAS